MATDVNFLLVSLTSYSTLKLGSFPGAEDNKIGDFELLSFSTTNFISTGGTSNDDSPKTFFTNLLAITVNLSGLNNLIIVNSLQIIETSLSNGFNDVFSEFSYSSFSHPTGIPYSGLGSSRNASQRPVLLSKCESRFLYFPY